MTKTTPLVAIPADVTYACYRSAGLKPWHLLAGSLPAATSAPPEVQNLLTSLTNWEHKP
jgi:hypothetical protein